MCIVLIQQLVGHAVEYECELDKLTERMTYQSAEEQYTAGQAKKYHFGRNQAEPSSDIQ